MENIYNKSYNLEENALEDLKNEYEKKLKQQNDLLKATKVKFDAEIGEKEARIELLQKKVTGLQDIVVDYMNREEKTNNIIISTQNLQELESKRMQLLYKKWKEVYNCLENIIGKTLSKSELDDIVKDFQSSFKMIVEGSNSQLKNKLSSKQEKNSKRVTKKYVAKSSVKKRGNITVNVFEEKMTVSQNESEAEKFLNGQKVLIPKVLGVGKEVLTIPPMHKQEEKKDGFSLEEALTPKESLSEIMSVFNLDD
ncbi:MAG: hypothetical protein IJ837_04495 [Clostridia bacterium]|nr:hypothetical protein [Clostridia bacterium]